MNAPILRNGVVRLADLRDRRECARIDDYVAAHPVAEPFHRPQWSRGVERGCRQKSHYLIAAEQGGRLTGCLPLTEIRSVLFGRALVSAGFATGGGIIADNDKTAQLLARTGWDLAERLGCPTMELRGGVRPAGWQARDGVYASFSRALPTADEKALLKLVPRRQRADVRKAMEHRFDVTAGSDTRHRDAHYRVYSESVRNLGTPIFPRSLFDAMLDEHGDDSDILVVWREGEPLSAILSFYFRDCCYPFWGGGTAAARPARANDLLYFAAMRHAAARGCTRIDFGRSKLGTGAYDRKRNWGFEETPLVYSVRTADGASPREINPLSPKYRLQVRLWSKLPLPLANAIGPHIARGLG